MAKSKYTEEIVKIIIESIEKYGRDKDAIKLAGIGTDTFYTWKKTYPEFSEQIKRAKITFKETQLGGDIGIASLAASRDILENGKTVVIETTTKPGKKTIKKRSPVTGRMVVSEIHEEEPTVVRQVRHYPPSDTLLSLYAPITITTAQKLLEMHGFAVVDPTIPTEQENSKGISEETFNTIRGEILGVKNNDQN